MSSPTKRTLAYLRKQRAYTAAVVEHWNQFARVRQDLFGFIDIVALNPSGHGVIGVQATSTPNMAARREKIKENKYAKLWLACGNRIWLVGWKKRGPRGGVKKWCPDIEEITLKDF